MKTNVLLFVAVVVIFLVGTLSVSAQKKAKLGKVCGNPNLSCKSRGNFQPSDLPFDTGKNFVIMESEPFYAIVLKSTKPAPDADCEKIFPESERISTQGLFPNNKVFVLRCNYPGENYYSGIGQDLVLIAVFAGKTLAEANNFLKMVQATNKFPGIRVRKMHAGINGT